MNCPVCESNMVRAEIQPTGKRWCANNHCWKHVGTKVIIVNDETWNNTGMKVTKPRY